MSIEILDKTRPKPPKFVYEKWAKKWKPAENASRLEKDRFVDQELNRWVKGFEGLSGRHYMYMTMGSIRDSMGEIIRPIWRDGDMMMFEEYEHCVKMGLDLMVVKRREFGLTSIFAGMEPIYNAIINKGSTSLITSADSKRLQTAFSEKVMVYYSNLEDDFRPGHLRERMAGFLHLGIKDKATGKILGADSKVYCIETASSDTNAKAFEAYRSNYIFLDEAFIHPRVAQVRSSAQATLSKGFSKMGAMVIGGSCGAETKEEAEALRKGAALGERLWNDSESLDLKTVFVPGWLCIANADELDSKGNKTGVKLNFCVNGYSDEKAATEWILKKREKLEKASDKGPYYNFIKQYPLTVQEVFEINRAAFFPPEVYRDLNKAKAVVVGGESPTGVFDLVRENGVVIRRPNNKGSFYILAEPKANETYIAGMDPIPYGDSSETEGSDNATSIKGLTTQEYVAYICERDLDADASVEKCILLQEYYKSQRFPHGAIVNIEKNRGEVVLKTYKDKGKEHLLARTPTHLGIEYVHTKSKYGWFANQHTMIRGNHYIVEFLKKYSLNQRLLRLIEEALVFPQGKLDLFDSMRSCEILDAEITESDKKVFMPVATRKLPIVTRDSSGRTVTKWIDAPIR